jgi:hypothetical protein
MQPIVMRGYSFSFELNNKDRNLDLLENKALLNEIAFDAITKYAADLENLKDKSIKIIIDVPENFINEVSYQIDKINPVNRIAKQNIAYNFSPSSKTTDLYSILKLPEMDSVQPKGYLEWIIHGCFKKISWAFEQIQWLFTGISLSQERLKWDLCVLSEICNSPFDRKMTMQESLQYILTILKKENSSSCALQQRLENTLSLMELLKKAEKSPHHEKDVQEIVDLVKGEICQLKDEEDKYLIPVKLDSLGAEVLLEVSKGLATNTYKLSLISADKEMRDFFLQEGDLQVMRREVHGISANELLASIRSLVELQVSPKRNVVDQKEFLLKTLHFKDSTVTMGECIPHSYEKNTSSLGHFLETLTLLGGEKNQEEADKFQLEVRLRAFFDLAKAGKESYKNKAFWELMHTTCLELAETVSGGGKSLFGKAESDRISKKLEEIIQKLEKNPPKMPNISRHGASYLKEQISLTKPHSICNLHPSKVAWKKHAEPPANSPLIPTDFTVFSDVITGWEKRLNWLGWHASSEVAYNESKIMVGMMKKFDFNQPRTEEEYKSFIRVCYKIGQFLAKKPNGMESTLQDVLYMTMLTFYAQVAANKAPYKMSSSGECVVKEELDALKKCALEAEDMIWIKSAEESYKLESYFITPKQESADFDALASLMKTKINHQKEPISLRVPRRVNAILKDTYQIAVVDWCTAGCHGNAHLGTAKLPTEHMMLCTDEFQPKQLMKEAKMPWREAVEFLYTQQTFQHAEDFNSAISQKRIEPNTLYTAEETFNKEDRKAQIINTFIVYQRNPDYFKDSSLRYAFTRKFFGNNALSYLCTNANAVFLKSAIRGIKDVIQVSKRQGDNHVAAYLFDVLRKMRDVIKENPFSKSQEIIALIDKWQVEEEIKGCVQAVVTGTAGGEEEQKLVVLPIALDFYFRKMERGESFAKEEVIDAMKMVGLLGKVQKDRSKIDIELQDRYLMLKHWLSPQVRAFSDTELEQLFCAIYPEELNIGGKASWDRTGYPTLKRTNGKDICGFNILTGEKMSLGAVRTEPLPGLVLINEDVKRVFTKELLDLADWKVLSGVIFPQRKESFRTSKAIPTEAKKSLYERLKGLRFSMPSLNKASKADADADKDTSLKEPKKKSFYESLKSIAEKYYYKEEVTVYENRKCPDKRVVVIEQKAEDRYGVKVEKVRVQKKYGSEWLDYVRFQAQDDFSKGVIKKESDLSPQMLSIIQDRECWMNAQANKVYVMENGRVYATLAIAKGHIIDVQLRSNKQHLLEVQDKALESFSVIEDPSCIQVAGYKNDPRSLVYFRRKFSHSQETLSYEKQRDGSFISPQMPGFKLQPFGTRPGMSGEEVLGGALPKGYHAFHLLKKDTAEKVVISFDALDFSKTQAGKKLLQSKMQTSEKTASSVFEYDLNPNTNRLKAKNSEGYIYLAYLCFVHGDYALSQEYIKQAFSHLEYSAAYTDVFRWVQEAATIKTPNELALRLRFSLFEETVTKNPKRKQEVCLRVAHLYKQYKKQQTNIHQNFQLEEKELLQLRGILHEFSEKIQESEEAKKLKAEQAIDQNEGLVPSFFYSPKIWVQQDEIGLYGVPSISREAKYLWVNQQDTKKAFSFAVLQDPEWIVYHFVQVLKTLIDFDVDSEPYKTLKKQILAVSEQTIDEDILLVQRRLLQMCEWKERGCSLEINQIEKHLRSCSAILDPNISRLELATQYFQLLMKEGVAKKITDTKQANVLKSELEDLKSEWQEALKNLKRGFISSSQNTVTQSRILEQAIKVAKGLEEFVEKNKNSFSEEECKKELTKLIYGEKTLLAARELHNICRRLSEVELPEVKTEMAKALVLKKMEEDLTEDIVLKEEMTTSEVIALQQAINERIVAPKRDRVKTDPTLIESVLDQKYKNRFEITLQTKTIPIPGLLQNIEAISDPASKRLAEEHAKGVRSLSSKNNNASLTRKKASELLLELQNDEQTLKKMVDSHRKKMLMEIDRESKPELFSLERFMGYVPKLAIEEAIYRWREGELSPALSNSVKDYLLLATKHQHLLSSLELVQKYVAERKENKDLAEEIFATLDTKRYYAEEDTDFKNLLFVEYTQKIILRDSQVDTVREMIANPNAVRQLRMGQGKSKVLMPILAKEKATGKNLVMLLLPEGLYETNCSDLDMTNRQLFGQKMYRFDFSRNSDLSKDALKKIHLELLRTIYTKGYVTSTKRSVLSFRNACLEQFYQLKHSSNSSEIREKIKIMSDILLLFQEKTDVLADEVDSLLNIREEVNFALGSSTSTDPVKGEQGVALFQLMLKSKNASCQEIAQLLKDNTQAALSDEKKKALLTGLADEYAEENKAKYRVSKEELALYLINDPKTSKETLEEIGALKVRDKQLYKEITTVKGFINVGLMTSLSKIGNVNYGRDPESFKWTIPYSGSRAPRVGSEFDDDIEKITFMLQDYLQNGVSILQVQTIVSSMEKAAKQEIAALGVDTFVSCDQTTAAKSFQKVLAQIGLSAFENTPLSSFIRTPALCKVLTAAINQDPATRLVFCGEVLKEMSQFPLQIRGDALDSVDMFCHYSGFTGTLWNRHTFHDKIQATRGAEEDAVTWDLLYNKKNIAIQEFDFDPTKPIDSLLDTLDIAGNYQAVIDLGKYLRGTSNGEFIDAAIERNNKSRKQKIAAGVYFDDAGRIVKKKAGEETSLPIEIAKETDLMKTITLYDDIHTTGTDIRQGKTAKAIVTIGENTFIRDLFQAVWRMRQLHRDQTVVFAVSNKIKERIPHKGSSLTLDDILSFCLANEAARESNDNYRAEKEKIVGAPKRKLFSDVVKAVANGELTGDSLDKMAHIMADDNHEFFMQKKDEDLSYDQYGMLKVGELTQKVLLKEKGNAEKQCETIASLVSPITKNLADSFFELQRGIHERSAKDDDLYPKEVLQGANSKTETMVEAQKEQQKEAQKEQQKETQKEQQKEMFKTTQNPKKGGGEGTIEPVDGTELLSFIQGHFYGPDRIATLPDDIAFPCNNQGAIACTHDYEMTPLSGANMFFHQQQKTIMMVLIAKCDGEWKMCDGKLKQCDGEWKMIIPTMYEAHKGGMDCIQALRNNPEISAALVALSCNSSPIVVDSNAKEGLPFTSPEDEQLVVASNAGEGLPFTSPEDEQRFYELYVRAKLLNGDVAYNTDKEKEALRRLFNKSNVQAFREHFEKHVLPQKTNQHQFYYASSLYQVFKELDETLTKEK